MLCRLALGSDAIDAASFTVIRLVSGVMALMLIHSFVSRADHTENKGSWLSAIMLFVYAITFSFAYISLATGTGALILFGAVQLTMMLSALLSGDRPTAGEWLGALLAAGGLVYLVLPGVTAPSVSGSLLMAAAGTAWGVYSLRGRGIRNPLAYTTFNFVRTLPFVFIILAVSVHGAELSGHGVVLAVLSGAFASGIGYAVWYVALTGLSSTQAAVVQLLVPVLAAAGGVLFMAEEISLRLVIAAGVIFAGVSLSFLRVSAVRSSNQ